MEVGVGSQACFFFCPGGPWLVPGRALASAAGLLGSLSSPRLLRCLSSSPSPRTRASRVAGEKTRPWSPSASYDLRERLCPGSALGNPGGPEQQVPTDEAEARMLGSADLDDMKSE